MTRQTIKCHSADQRAAVLHHDPLSFSHRRAGRGEATRDEREHGREPGLLTAVPPLAAVAMFIVWS